MQHRIMPRRLLQTRLLLQKKHLTPLPLSDTKAWEIRRENSHWSWKSAKLHNCHMHKLRPFVLRNPLNQETFAPYVPFTYSALPLPECFHLSHILHFLFQSLLSISLLKVQSPDLASSNPYPKFEKKYRQINPLIPYHWFILTFLLHQPQEQHKPTLWIELQINYFPVINTSALTLRPTHRTSKSRHCCTIFPSVPWAVC